ncbi:hypothetical protein NDU88_001242 [Pleurodeles waltl]|uniref:Uncharacterized protein n=1 Tax=Pleurodeles waltl TaxID=8319 RepID=A0AAV7NEK3_PLEWA|nr:hypothetical protein NDU88_001242 [Pleurodeles waltl]
MHGARPARHRRLGPTDDSDQQGRHRCLHCDLVTPHGATPCLTPQSWSRNSTGLCHQAFACTVTCGHHTLHHHASHRSPDVINASVPDFISPEFDPQRVSLPDDPRTDLRNCHN